MDEVSETKPARAQNRAEAIPCTDVHVPGSETIVSHDRSSSAGPADPAKRNVPVRATTALALAIALGLSGGYLDLILISLKKYLWDEQGHFHNARDFPWSVPLVHVLLLLVPGLILALLTRLRGRLLTLHQAASILATLAIWSALLRMPLYGAASFVLACALGIRAADLVVAGYRQKPHRGAATIALLVGTLGVLVIMSSGWHAWRQLRAARLLPPALPQARNVVLIVLDTVRAYNMSAYGYPRDTTPNLRKCAQRGVQFRCATAPAPWTFPSHECFFTGRWPHELDSRRSFTVESSAVTLAEHLAARGYQTAGFVGNTVCCSYESKLDRGFLDYDDYVLSPLSLLGRTIPGRWILKQLVYRGDFHAAKWIDLQARDAQGITCRFLNWLPGRQPNRPFFVFLNYFDAHGPYIPPSPFAGRLGVPPNLPRDFQFLLEYEGLLLTNVAPRDVLMARDRYDDCIAYLDAQIGRLLDELERQKLLDQTLVIITSDHGESFGDHGTLGHGTSLFLDQIGVPLIMLFPGAPGGRAVSEPVSLRDLPATVVDQAGVAGGNPFPGHSLAALWQALPGEAAPRRSQAFSELVHLEAFEPQPQNTPRREGFEMSLIDSGRHYIRDGTGAESLYDLGFDPLEELNLAKPDQDARELLPYRKDLLDLVTAHPGTRAVERAYLAPMRTWLRSLVVESPASRAAASRRLSAVDLPR